MRYRSFGRSDVAVSTLTLTLADAPGKSRAADWHGIVFAALENGVNAFDLTPDVKPGVMTGLGDALESLERRLCFVTLRCTVGPGDLGQCTVLRKAAEAAETIGIERFDCLMLEGPGLDGLQGVDLRAMADLREIAGHIGVSGDRDLDSLALKGLIDAVTVDYSLISPVVERNRIRQLSAAGVAVLIDGACPQAALEAPAPARRGLFRRAAYAQSGGYDFLHQTPGWTAEQICIGYALTEPGVTSVRVAATDAGRLAMLADAVERDVSASLSAQVEMARFAAAPVLRRA